MPVFVYEASDKNGAIIRGEFEAKDKRAIIERLSGKNLIPIIVQEKGSVESKKGLSFVVFGGVNSLDRILFVRNLGAAIKAGLNIIEAMDILIADTARTTMKNILIQAKINLQNGQPLYETFKAFKRFFPAVFVGMLKAGEASGKLDNTLDELGQYLSREYNLTQKVRSALIYPAFLLASSVGVVVLLMAFVMPRLVKTFESSGVKFPFVTQVIIDISKIITYSPLLDLVVIAGVVGSIVYFRKTAAGKRFFANLFIKLPVLRDVAKKVVLVRFSRTLGNLISGGVSVVEALSLSAESAGNEIYKEIILESAEQIKSGIPISKSLERHPDFFPRFLTSLMLVGEKTGTLGNILKSFADFSDEEVDNQLKSLTSFVEPILLLFMGLVIGTIALAILLPIYNLVGSFR